MSRETPNCVKVQQNNRFINNLKYYIKILWLKQRNILKIKQKSNTKQTQIKYKLNRNQTQIKQIKWVRWLWLNEQQKIILRTNWYNLTLKLQKHKSNKNKIGQIIIREVLMGRKHQPAKYGSLNILRRFVYGSESVYRLFLHHVLWMLKWGFLTKTNLGGMCWKSLFAVLGTFLESSCISDHN